MNLGIGLGVANKRGSAAARTDWYGTAWPSRKEIVIDHTKVAADMAAFEMYFNISADAEITAAMRQDGDDLVVTLADGVTKIPHEKLSTNLISDDGIWTWFNSPRAIRVGDVTYSGYLSTNGSVFVTSLNHTSGATFSFCLSYGVVGSDDHNNPAFLLLPSGKIAAFYCQHPGASFYRVTTNAGDITAWGAAVQLPQSTNVVSETNQNYSYVNPFLIGSTIFLFTRVSINNFYFIRYKTCTSEANLIAGTWTDSVTYLQGADRPYVTVCGNAARDAVHFTFTDGHPDSNVVNNVYYMKFDGTNFMKADGTVVGSTAALPLDPAVVDKVYNSTASGIRAWTSSIVLDATEKPVVGYMVYPGSNGAVAADHRYRYGRWNGTAWIDNEVYPGGGPLYAGQPHYSGGIAVDPEDVNVCYTCSNYLTANWVVRKHVTADSGATWVTTVIHDKGHYNFRPYLVKGHTGGPFSLMWCTGPAGSYPEYHVYTTGIATLGPITPTKEAWIKTPVSASVDPKLYIYFGNPLSADQSDAANVWANAATVLHMQPSGLGYTAIRGSKSGIRSTKFGVNNNLGHGGPVGSFTSGKLSGGAQTYANGLYFNLNEPLSISGQTKITLSGWFKGATGYLLSNWSGAGAGAGSMMMRVVANVCSGFIVLTSGQIGSTMAFAGITFNTSTWHLLHLVYDNAVGLKGYCDGVVMTTGTYAGSAAVHATPATQWAVGSSPHAPADARDNTVDEARIRLVAMSANDILTEYRSQSGIAAFYTLGVLEGY